MNKESIHFHWRLVQSGEEAGHVNSWQNNNALAAWPDLDLQGHFCKAAGESGIESVLVDINYAKPDPTLLTTALVKQTDKLGFIIAVRSGLLSPTLFTQQINTLSTFSNGRIYLNVVAGHTPAEQKIYGDFLTHDQRYERTDDFLNVCTQFWNNNGLVNVNGKYIQVEEGKLNTPYVSDNSTRPYIFIGGGSQPAVDLTLKYGDCLMQLGDTPEKIKQKIKPVIDGGKAAGLRFSVICRPTNAESVEAANQLMESSMLQAARQNQMVTTSDSQSIKSNYNMATDNWPCPNLWTGAVKTIGPTSLAIVGSYEEVAAMLMQYRQLGVTHFILSGWPKLDEMIRFGKYVIPAVRALENKN